MASLLRLHVPQSLAPATSFDLPPEAVRHVQVRRLQPGDPLRVFDGRGHEWQAELLQMGRQNARVRLTAEVAALPELPWQVTLAIGVPANERMDALVEKATELGVSCLQPLQTERSVLRLSGERAQRRCAHWQAIAVAGCEQSGRAQVPTVEPLLTLSAWLAALPASVETPDRPVAHRRWVLTPEGGTPVAALRDLPGAAGPLLALSGPEGGLSPAEVDLARQQGFEPLHLGPRVLRADTAPLALMAWLSLLP
jgi:16S rRNA (uracil1498-N3)-methyltransferase